MFRKSNKYLATYFDITGIHIWQSASALPTYIYIFSGFSFYLDYYDTVDRHNLVDTILEAFYKVQFYNLLRHNSYLNATQENKLENNK